MTSAPFLSAIVTVLAVAFYFHSAMRVGILRGRLGIKAPATSGQPEFDRAYRVQLNTLEQMGIFLPLLWVNAIYPILPWLAPMVGVVWIIGRFIYRASYMADPEKRIRGAVITGLTSMALLVLAIAGLVRAGLNGTL
jgi:glutathione S-transferase